MDRRQVISRITSTEPWSPRKTSWCSNDNKRPQRCRHLLIRVDFIDCMRGYSLYCTTDREMSPKIVPSSPTEYMVSWSQSSKYPKRHLDRFISFIGIAIVTVRLTHRHTHIQTHSDWPRNIGNNRPHLMFCIAVRPNNVKKYSEVRYGMGT